MATSRLPLYLKISAAVTYSLAVMFSFLSLLLVKWSHTDENIIDGSFNTGLWKVCFADGLSGCHSWSDYESDPDKVLININTGDSLVPKKDIPPENIHGLRALVLFHILFGFSFIATWALSGFSQRKRLFKGLSVAVLAAAGLFGVGAAIYGHNQYLNSKFFDNLQDTKSGACPGLQMAAAVFYFFCATLYLVLVLNKSDDDDSATILSSRSSSMQPSTPSKTGPPVVVSSTTAQGVPLPERNSSAPADRSAPNSPSNNYQAGDNPFGSYNSPAF